jgi:hypothetical protein
MSIYIYIYLGVLSQFGLTWSLITKDSLQSELLSVLIELQKL